ncbi:hypothetical protein FACS1894202_13690 [Clostridia bacterium]|nr:hypothetical protein FACS1894202_13690 [Clostridia bacterium]
METGLDTAATVTQKAADEAKARNYSFICRYYASGATPKVIRAEEAQMLSDSGFYLVSVFQDYNNAPSWFSADYGKKHGAEARVYAQKICQPPHSAIYFAVDFDAQPDEINGVVKDYFTAVKEALGGLYEVGVYGSGSVCAAMKEQYKLAAYSWLAGATDWSGSKGYDNRNIKQIITKSGLNIGDISFDGDEADGDFGGWRLGDGYS